MRRLVLAPHVEFDEAKHEYWYEGRQLFGVTGLISKKLGLKMPQEFVEEHQMEGVHVHKAVQRWIETGDPESVHPMVSWLINEAGLSFWKDKTDLYSEVLVSDFKQYASAVDIVIDRGSKGLSIGDIKKGVFKRDYVTWQLSIYKYLIETYAGNNVASCVCFCARDKEIYPIFPKPREQVEKLLYGK